MSRSLALIQGNLALPNARLLRGLPPPYGVYRWPARAAAQRRPQPAASTAERQAIQGAVRRGTPQAHHSLFAPGQKFRFFYKLPQPRDNSWRFDAELAEARNYLEMGKVRQRSSRSDHVLGATIFVACSVILALLLTTGATHDTNRAATAATTGPAVAMHGAEVAVKVAQSAPLAPSPMPKTALRSEPKPLPQAALPFKRTLSAQHIKPYPAARASTYETATSRATEAKADRKMAAARLSEAQVDERPALNRSVRGATRAIEPTQPEWSARLSADDATEQAAWLDRAARQRRTNVTPRTSIPAPTDADWNVHMTQRRITDNPAAFQAPSGQN